jgi:hypothetical protein
MKKSSFAGLLMALILPIPFTSQAPLAQWSDPRFQDGCEEASVIMVMKWVNKEAWPSGSQGKLQAQKEILALAAYEDKKYHNYHDTSAADTMDRLIKGYYGYNKAAVKTASSSRDLIKELDKGGAIIVPTNGRLLKNPNFTAPGPLNHMLVIKGYDSKTGEFITNDPGTRNGQSYRYPYAIMWKAISDYPTGQHLPRKGDQKNYIVVWR